jgi:hypothetical protein
MKRTFAFLLACIVLIPTVLGQKDIAIEKQKRLALIIGNKDYKFATVLKNTTNDARDMAATLKGVGFETMLYTDVDYTRFLKIVDTFSRKAPDYDILLFYYSGHGMMYQGENYLVPTDAALRNNEQQIEVECLNIKRITSNFNIGEGKANIAIVDACRNKPFNRSWMTNSKGIDDTNPYNIKTFRASGTITALSAGEGETSSDNPKGTNGLYTASLIKFIKEPGLSVNEVFQLTRKEVKEKSRNSQNPIEFNELIGNFYFTVKNDLTTKIAKNDKKTSPKSDSDEDGIADNIDKCPNEKGDIKNGGCPPQKTAGVNKDKKEPGNQSSGTATQTTSSVKPLESVSVLQTVKLQEGASIRLVLKEDINSKTAVAGDRVQLEVDGDVVVDGYIVIKAGTPAKGEITEASKAKLFKGGTLTLNVNFTTAVDNQMIRIHSNTKSEGKDNAVLSIALFFPLKGGKAKIAKGTKFSGYVDSNYTINISQAN